MSLTESSAVKQTIPEACMVTATVHNEAVMSMVQPDAGLEKILALLKGVQDLAAKEIVDVLRITQGAVE